MERIVQTQTQSNRQILETLLEGGFKTPEVEYGYRSEDFVAEIPQTGEVFDRDSLMEMQKAMGDAPAVEVKRITGEGDVWVVEAVNSYSEQGDFYVCVVAEFRDGQIIRETRYYGPPLETDRT